MLFLLHLLSRKFFPRSAYRIFLTFPNDTEISPGILFLIDARPQSPSPSVFKPFNFFFLRNQQRIDTQHTHIARGRIPSLFPFLFFLLVCRVVLFLVFLFLPWTTYKHPDLYIFISFYFALLSTFISLSTYL